jgi:3-phosphoshikimate 1-carboxyvinyltransferase
MPSYRAGPVDRIAGEVTIPGDKSISHRAVMFGAIASGTTRIDGFLDGGLSCDDTGRATARCRSRSSGPGTVVVRGAGLRGLQPPQAISTWETPAPRCACSWTAVRAVV